jgi:hypothetical protein
VAGTFGLERPAQSGNVPLNQVHRIPGGRLTPYGIDHLLPTNRSTSLQHQHGQDHPLLNRPEIYDSLAPPDPERAQDAESQRGSVRIIHGPLPAAKRNFTLS